MTPEERQQIEEEMGALKVRYIELIGMGPPAEIEAVRARHDTIKGRLKTGQKGPKKKGGKR